jgi:hypothetical protein
MKKLYKLLKGEEEIKKINLLLKVMKKVAKKKLMKTILILKLTIRKQKSVKNTHLDQIHILQYLVQHHHQATESQKIMNQSQQQDL